MPLFIRIQLKNVTLWPKVSFVHKSLIKNLRVGAFISQCKSQNNAYLHNSIAMLSQKTPWPDSNPGLVIHRQLRWPLRHTARAKRAKKAEVQR
jgi:hypothetical protein